VDAHLTVVGHRSSQPVTGAEGAPIDLTDATFPSSVHASEAKQLFRALSDALREMRVRQGQASADATTPLRLGIIATAENGTALDVQTASTNLRTLDLDAEPDREAVLRELRALEREFLEGN